MTTTPSVLALFPIRFSIRVTHIIESSLDSACATEYNRGQSGDTNWNSNLGTGNYTVRKDYQNLIFSIQSLTPTTSH